MPTRTKMLFQAAVQAELRAVRRRHAAVASVHEGYAVILEELEEFWEEVRKKRTDRSQVGMWDELVQIAAMAQRTAEDVLLTNPSVADVVRDRL